ncbi:histidine-type phosphatase [Erwinia billingiae]|uniref:histidine-type phosphatase n=1 Tax=Erwinia billingiae TaxID=182337 RepID=UPI00124403BE|nr:histidine-type phosphatase [Erwinia billingiae]QEW33347.1 histidine-type phosphatase [Erwinia billingiae]
MDAKLSLVTTLMVSVLYGVFSPCAAAKAEDYTLEKVVEVSRHGVRPPTPGDRQSIEAGTQRSWPRWLTTDGNLTGHGYTAVWLKARYEAGRYRQLGVLKAGCPSPGDVYIRSSPLQRTQASAEAWSAAAFPGCGVPVHALDKDDALFAFPSDKVSEPQKARYKQEALAALGGTPEQAQQRLKPQIDALKHAVCQHGQPCPAFDRPWTLNVWSNGGIAIQGLDTLAAMAESIRLAWSENQPLSKVAFGQADSAARVSALLPLLTAKYDFTNDLPSAARRGGSVLLDQIAKALQTSQSQDAPPDVRWLLFVASDINLSYLRTLLHFSWQQGDYPRGNLPPGGSLVFERWRDNLGKRFLRVYFQSQSLDQLRQLTPISASDPLLTTEWHPDGCKRTEVGTLCPYDATLQRIEQATDRSSRVPVSYPQSASQP